MYAPRNCTGDAVSPGRKYPQRDAGGGCGVQFPPPCFRSAAGQQDAAFGAVPRLCQLSY